MVNIGFVSTMNGFEQTINLRIKLNSVNGQRPSIYLRGRDNVDAESIPSIEKKIL